LNTGKVVVPETVPLQTLPTESPVITRSSGEGNLQVNLLTS